MKAELLALVISLCGEDKSCLSQTVVLDPKTSKETALTVNAVQARDKVLKNRGFSECGPYPGCFEDFQREEKAQFYFKCELKGESKDCWKDWYLSKEHEKLSREYDAKERGRKR